jgi:DNA polymerase-3 subunit alpha
MKYVPLQLRSTYSFLRGLPQPDQIVSFADEQGIGTMALTDSNLSGFPSLVKAAKDAGSPFKPIAGLEMMVRADGGDGNAVAAGYVTLLAMGNAGWARLMKLYNVANREAHWLPLQRPSLPLDELLALASNSLVVIDGQRGSALASCLRAPGSAELAPDWKERARAALGERIGALGPRFFVGLSPLIFPADHALGSALAEAARAAGAPRVFMPGSSYLRPEDAADHRLLLAVSLRSTLSEAKKKCEGDPEMARHFWASRFHVPGGDEVAAWDVDSAIQNTFLVAEMCGAVALGRPPLFPRFECPGGATPEERLKELCRIGWTERIAKKVPPSSLGAYAERAKKELDVFLGAGLAPYFLVVDDYARYARDDLGCMVGPRGSGSGCLTSYSLGFSPIDPIKHDLSFERFYDSSRNTPGKTSLPDIDLDFPVWARDKVFAYIDGKYGRDHVAQMATFTRMQGRGALKDVLRVHGRCSYGEMNKITEPVPDESAIADDLQEMEDSSIILWALEHRAKALADWCVLNEDGSLSGPMGPEFAQAVRLEGTKRGKSRHASGVVACCEKLEDVCPMAYDHGTKRAIIDVDMRDAESAFGLVKCDVLGNLMLDKLMGAEALINGR